MGGMNNGIVGTGETGTGAYWLAGLVGTALGFTAHRMHGWRGVAWCCVGLALGVGSVALLA